MQFVAVQTCCVYCPVGWRMALEKYRLYECPFDFQQMTGSFI